MTFTPGLDLLNLAASPYNEIASLGAILALAMVHLYVGALGRLQVATQQVLLAAGAGASLSYVMMHMLPKLAEKHSDLLASVEGGLLGFLQHHVYLVALMGMLAYYWFTQIPRFDATAAGSAASAGVRSAVIASTAGYAAYSLLIGYLLVDRIDPGSFGLVLAAGAMGTLFLVTDNGLYKKWPNEYDRWMRWVLSLALFAGWLLGVFVEVSANVIALWYALLAGVILITTIKEKVKIEEPAMFWPFLAGVAIFALLRLVLEFSLEAQS